MPRQSAAAHRWSVLSDQPKTCIWIPEGATISFGYTDMQTGAGNCVPGAFRCVVPAGPGGYASYRLTARHTLWPPKPNELLSASRTGRSTIPFVA
jgi:hypothetical protein